MNRIADATVAVVAIIHIAIMGLEMFPTDCPILLSRLQNDLGFAEGQGKFAAPIVQNAGLFNGFLAAGLLWSLKSQVAQFNLRIFFLSFIALAGLFGAITLPGNTTLWIQSIPAAIAIFVNVGASSAFSSPPDDASTQVDLEASVDLGSSVAEQ